MIFFFFNDTATTEIYTLSLHDALPIYACDGFTNRGQSRSQISCNTDAHPRVNFVFVLPVSYISHRHRTLEGAVKLCIFHDSDNLIRSAVEADRTAQRQPGGENLVCKCLVHDGDSRRGWDIVCVEIAAGDKGDMERCEVVREMGLESLPKLSASFSSCRRPRRVRE